MGSQNQRGQTILLVVLVMIVALSIGIGVSTRFIKNVRINTMSDSSSRAVAIAEAAIERMLTLPNSTLSDYINNGCGTNCTLQITGSDGIVATANVTLTFEGASPDPLAVSLSTTDVTEINLDTYPDDTNVYVCWDTPTQGERPSVTSLFVYGTQGDFDLDSYAINSLGSSHGDNNFNDAVSSFGYTHCFTVNGRANPQVLRLRAIYNNVDAFVVPETNETIPSQGIRIESVGEVAGAVKKVVVVKTEPYLPAQFDFAILQTSTTEPLSN